MDFSLTYKSALSETSSATKRRLLREASLSKMDFSLTYKSALRETSLATKRRLLREMSPETTTPLFRVVCPFTYNAAFNDTSLATNNRFVVLTSFANIAFPATYKLLLREISAPTNNLPFNDKSRPTNKYLSVRILPSTSMGNSIFVEELTIVKSVPVPFTNIPVALTFNELPTLNGGTDVGVLTIKVYLFPR